MKVSVDGTSIVENGRQQLVVEVRDRYNNPVSGATVHFTLAGAEQGTSHELDNGTTTGEAVQVTTGADGQASVTYHLDSISGNGDDVTVRVSIDDVPPMGGRSIRIERRRSRSRSPLSARAETAMVVTVTVAMVVTAVAVMTEHRLRRSSSALTISRIRMKTR
jgi:hypothetical protein